MWDNVSLLQYADDTLFFGEWFRRNALNLIHNLKCFDLGSGLKVNISKSRILGVGVSASEIEAVASSIGCAHETFPFSYIGLPVGIKMRLKEGWNAIIDRFIDRLSSWKAKSVSIGVGSLLAKKLGLLCEWKWRFRSEDMALCDKTRLSEAFLRLYALETSKDCSISDRWHMKDDSGVGIWSWSHPLRGKDNDDLASLISRIRTLHLSKDGVDKWTWSLDASVNFCSWRASLNRLPTRMNLNLHGVNMVSDSFPLCDTNVEDIEHCLIN
ncbi:RNA-directed DNA polymerase, eukaryota, reverse transcriptase zinc-binding domain protein [Tanacetum coccineum]